MKIKKTIVLLVLVAIVFALVGCGGAKYSGEKNNMVSFEYNYGSYHGGYWNYSLSLTEKGEVRFIAAGMNGVDLDIDAVVDASVFSELAALIYDNEIYKWDGFNRSAWNVLDGYSFGLSVIYGDGASITAGGYMKQPKGYEQGHAVLAQYLWDFANSVPTTPIHSAESVDEIRLAFEEGYAITVVPSSNRVVYEHGRVTQTFDGEPFSKSDIEDFTALAVAFYNNNRPQLIYGPRSLDDCWESPYIPGGFQCVIYTEKDWERSYYAVSDDGGAFGEDLAELAEAALALIGRPADYAKSEAFGNEEYTSSFIYPTFFFYDPSGVGEVVVEALARTITVDGETFAANGDALLAFELDFVRGNYFQTLESQGEILFDGALAGKKDAFGEYQAVTKNNWTWMFGYANGNADILYLAAGDGEVPAGWDTAREQVIALLQQIG